MSTQLENFKDMIKNFPNVRIVKTQNRTAIKYKLYANVKEKMLITTVFDEKGDFVSQRLGTRDN